MVIGVVADYLGIENTAGAVAGGYAAYRVGKTGFDIYRRVQKIQKIRSAPRADPRLRGTGFRDPRTGRAASRQAVQAGGGWLSGTTGRKFVAYISRKKGAVFLKAIIRLLGRVTAGLAVTATGVGVIPGLLWTALSECLPRGTRTEFNFEGLFRADMANRFNMYETAIRAGFMTTEEVRRKEGLE